MENASHGLALEQKNVPRLDRTVPAPVLVLSLIASTTAECSSYRSVTN